MAKMKIDFVQAVDHLEIGMDVTVSDGRQKPKGEQDGPVMDYWKAHNYNGTVIGVSPTSIDVEVKLPGADVINHFDSSFTGIFEIDLKSDSKVKNKDRLQKRSEISNMRRDDLFDMLMAEIDTLKNRVTVLENTIPKK